MVLNQSGFSTDPWGVRKVKKLLSIIIQDKAMPPVWVY
jgi:hypothetical protein